jgi:hypothetical protein
MKRACLSGHEINKDRPRHRCSGQAGGSEEAAASLTLLLGASQNVDLTGIDSLVHQALEQRGLDPQRPEPVLDTGLGDRAAQVTSNF